MLKSVIIFKKSNSRNFIEKCYNLPTGVEINKFSDIMFTNFSIKTHVPENGYYLMICEIESSQEQPKPLVKVSMTRTVFDLETELQQLEKEFGV